MTALVWVGAGLAALGVIGLIASGVLVMRARGAGEAALKATMARTLPLNLGSLLVSLLGLLCVVTGALLG